MNFYDGLYFIKDFKFMKLFLLEIITKGEQNA